MKIRNIALIAVIIISIVELVMIAILFDNIGRENSIIHFCLLFQVVALAGYIYKNHWHKYQCIVIIFLFAAVGFLAYKLISFL